MRVDATIVFKDDDPETVYIRNVRFVRAEGAYICVSGGASAGVQEHSITADFSDVSSITLDVYHDNEGD
jgi:hypothetical protein